MAVKLIVGEYNLLWKALKHYEEYLQHVSETAEDEDQRLFVDEDLEKMEYMLKNVRLSAKVDWDLDLK